MIKQNAVVLRTLVRGSLVASGVVLMMHLAGGAAFATPLPHSSTSADPSAEVPAVAASTASTASAAGTSAPTTNPFKGDKEKAAAGGKLFIAYGCVSCHGQGGGGGMGPSLIDSEWRYGGTDADVFHSIHDGRPKGMPAWSSHLTDDQIWEIITFVHSISIAE